MTTILLSAPYMLSCLERFRPVFKYYNLDLIVPTVNERLSEAEILTFAGQFDGAICGDDRYSKAVLESCLPRLKVISKWGTGIDSIDQAAAQGLGIRVCNTPNAFSMPVADSVLGYILTFARGLPWMDRFVKAGNWQKLPGRSLSECTLGVIGVGNVGKAVLRRARGFGMKLLGNDIVTIAPDFVLENVVEMTGLMDLLQRADFVSTNCDLNPTSYHIIRKETLDCMKREAVLINTARGPLVAEQDLVAALKSGRIAGAALDVFEVEPLPAGSGLRDFDNVLLAPHNSNSSPAAWERVHWNTICNLLEGLGIPCEDLDEQRLEISKARQSADC